MIKKAVGLLLVFAAVITLNAQDLRFTYKATRVLMDSTYNSPKEPVVKGIIDFYKPKMDSLMQGVVGYAAVEMRSSRPESLLSNFAVDALLEFAQKYSKKKVDFSLTNFGGIRAVLPAGPVRRYDIYSIFPFENYVVILDLSGASVRKLFDSFAKNRVEAMSYNVQLEIKGGVLISALIDGAQIDDSKIYRIATIDFLMGGGDNVVALKESVAVEETGMLIRDAIFYRIADLKSKGQKITSTLTKRVKLEN